MMHPFLIAVVVALAQSESTKPKLETGADKAQFERWQKYYRRVAAEYDMEQGKDLPTRLKLRPEPVLSYVNPAAGGRARPDRRLRRLPGPSLVRSQSPVAGAGPGPVPARRPRRRLARDRGSGRRLRGGMARPRNARARLVGRAAQPSRPPAAPRRGPRLTAPAVFRSWNSRGASIRPALPDPPTIVIIRPARRSAVDGDGRRRPWRAGIRRRKNS
jgi:hypothetical protein